MNKQRPGGDQIIRLLLLSFAAVLLYQHFFAPKPQQTPADKREVPALAQAFAGINPADGAPLDQAAATEEIKKLNAALQENAKDEYSDWALLRKGLLEQYIVKDSGAAKKTYRELTDKQGKQEADAQGLYQLGDLLWRESTRDGGKATKDAASTLEQLVHRGRGASAFLQQKIFVARGLAPSDPLTAIPPRFEQIAVGELRGTPDGADPQGILYRVDQYYRENDPYFLYRSFDTVVRWFGNQPAYSYGLAILFFAVFTRLLLQPLTKKQYESMKGMQVVAPEMKKIQDKYKGKTDPQVQQQMYKEIRAVYKDHGVSPMMGCGLALVQMPLFFLVIYPLIQHFEARMELAGASFLWMPSLAHADVPLLVLYGISQFLSFRLSSTPPTDDQQRMMQMMMSFVFPVVFPFFMATYPSAFILYWMAFNIISTVFQWRMMKAADPDRNVWKTLMGTGAAVGVDPTAGDALPAEAVPPRPQNGKKKARALPVETGERADSLVKTLFAGANGAANGSANGSADGAANGHGAAAAAEDEDAALTAGAADATDGTKSGSKGRSSSRRARRRRRH